MIKPILPASICIVRLGALGDVLMLVPLIRTLQATLPDTSLTWVISRPAYDLVEGLEGVEFIVIEKPQGFIDYWRFKQHMRARQFDILLATQASFRANLLYPLIRASRKIGFDLLRAKDCHRWVINETIAPGHDHTVDGFLKFADALGLEKKDIRWDLPRLAADEAWAKQHLPKTTAPIVLVNPAASKPERNWALDRYIAVIQHLQSRWQAEVVLTGGPSAYDKMLGDAIVNAVPGVTNLIGKTVPRQLMAVIAQADLMLCPDTGPSHMGAAVTTPVVALHAVTNKEVSGPYIYRHLAVDCYPEAVKTVLKSTMNANTWGLQAHGSEAMKLISVANVIAKLDDVMVDI